MTREHLVEDIQNVLEMVKRAAEDPQHAEVASNALRGLYRHFQDEKDVPGPVQGCLREAVRSVEAMPPRAEGETWRSARACLESALEFARGE